jgi:hypothetical protein
MKIAISSVNVRHLRGNVGETLQKILALLIVAILELVLSLPLAFAILAAFIILLLPIAFGEEPSMTLSQFISSAPHFSFTVWSYRISDLLRDSFEVSWVLAYCVRAFAIALDRLK